MERRRILTACGTVFAGLLAGCGGGGGGEATPTGTAEPTATETATPTATPGPGPDGPTHDLDESFTVGSGSEAIGYRIIDFYRADDVGSSANNDTADGTFLIVILELSNPRDDAISFPNNNFLAWNEEQIRYIDDNATPKIGDDDRIDVQPIGTATVLSGSSKTGAVVFDVDADQTYWLRINPTGDSGETHYVRVGAMSEVQELQGSFT